MEDWRALAATAARARSHGPRAVASLLRADNGEGQRSEVDELEVFEWAQASTNIQRNALQGWPDYLVLQTGNSPVEKAFVLQRWPVRLANAANDELEKSGLQLQQRMSRYCFVALKAQTHLLHSVR